MMTRFNHSAHFFIYLPIILATGCAQQSPSHLVIHETPAISEPLYPEQLLNIPPEIVAKNTYTQTENINHASIWDRLLSLYALSEIDNERVEQQLNWYLQHPENLTRIQQRAEPYLYFILDEIEAKKIPGELALLPAIESAFKPKAYSHSRAAGLWQFIPSTGRYFGLKQNWWYDGRRDVVASTRAATLYLKQLSEEFDDDWLLALASYNAGKGNIRKAIRQNNEQGLNTDYWSLNLRRETMNYVPRLLAIAKIFANPAKYNITLQDFPNQPYFEIVNVKSQLNLNKAVEMAQTPIDDFFMLNPGFNRWSTDPNGPHRLLIPINKADEFKNSLAKLPGEEWMNWIHHKISEGENLNVIAKKHGTTIQAIKQSNQLTSNNIRAGKHLLIPPISHNAKKQPLLAEQTHGQIYTVKEGDSFWQIARLFSVTSKNLARWNQLSINTTLRPGQRLVIKKSGNITVASSSINTFQSLHYTVKKGDSLSVISRKFNVSITDLRKWNNQTTGTYLQPGQKLKVMIDISQPST
jgi:membrane-bound lytic murein transglycosylase D